MTDPQLVVRAQAGDLPAFEELVKKYQREIYGLACRVVMDAEEAKDLTQQAFLQAFIHIRDFHQQAQFRTWLFRIALNQCYNFLKSKPPDLLVELKNRVGKLNPFPVSDHFNRAVRLRSGVERFHVHQCRHTFAWRWLERGGSLAALQQILGHSTMWPPRGTRGSRTTW